MLGTIEYLILYWGRWKKKASEMLLGFESRIMSHCGFKVNMKTSKQCASGVLGRQEPLKIQIHIQLFLFLGIYHFSFN